MSGERSIWRKPAFYIGTSIALVVGALGTGYFTSKHKNQQIANVQHELTESKTRSSQIKNKYAELLAKHETLCVDTEIDNQRTDELLQGHETTITEQDSEIKKYKSDLEQLTEKNTVLEKKLAKSTEEYTKQGKDLAFIGTEIRRIQDGYSDLEAQVKELSTYTKGLETTLEQAKNELEKSSMEYSDLEKGFLEQIKQLETNHRLLQNSYEQLKKDNDDSESTLTNANKIITDLGGQIENLSTHAKGLETTLEQAKKNVIYTQEELEKRDMEYGDLEKGFLEQIKQLETNHQLLQNSYEQLKKDNDDSESTLINANKIITDLGSQIENLSIYAKGLETALEEAENDITCAEEELEKSSREYGNLEKRSKGLETALEEAKNETVYAQEELKKSSQKYGNLEKGFQKQIKQLETDQQLLQNSYEQLKKDNDDSESTLINANNMITDLEGQVKKLSDINILFSYTYTKGLETALEEAENDITCAEEELEKSSREYGNLEKRSKGLETALEKAKNDITCAEEELEKSSRKYANLEKRSKGLETALEEAKNETVYAQEELKKSSQKYANLEKMSQDRIKGLITKTKALQTDYNQCQKEAAQLQQDIEEISEKYSLGSNPLDIHRVVPASGSCLWEGTRKTIEKLEGKKINDQRLPDGWSSEDGKYLFGKMREVESNKPLQPEEAQQYLKNIDKIPPGIPFNVYLGDRHQVE